jgi:Phycobilisome degradation protein nblA
MKPLDVSLTTEQQFQLRLFKNSVKSATRQDLEKMLLSMIGQNYALRNALASLLKPENIL